MAGCGIGAADAVDGGEMAFPLLVEPKRPVEKVNFCRLSKPWLMSTDMDADGGSAGKSAVVENNVAFAAGDGGERIVAEIEPVVELNGLTVVVMKTDEVE